MYEADLAEIYDMVYRGRGKDYAAEAAEVSELVLARRPDAVSLLDVACGTGAHLAFTRERFETVEGLELSEHMIAKAREALPGVPVHRGDMRDFDLGRTYDAAMCMFSSIGYLGSTGELEATLSRLARHLSPGGVLVIEPWYFPERFIDGYIARDLVSCGDRVVARVSHSTRNGRQVPITVHYIVADKSAGIRHFTDLHLMRLFTREEYERAFERAGFAVEYLTDGRFDCGLFVGVLK
ncbi:MULTISPECIES: class I SAM-dependent methyltransferase [Thermomonospora]|uniref:Methyltransferase type 11 n=1 Tax=Thermomonospora curvata (strain ATCC 19995 / DSM 43183 / JCM 3096 / KCTC 9072 / NBRC 15933 / NCIMB 10081 / Henssen B9) TaxID=471852 RepID=D1A6S9_THECD|nr:MULTISPECIES: class I SAM-dependent methyltransferase [Thermomonospora]ACY98333.1 Methyltransferase type 11 [Thermomonospora curvata DSM 43183]PKK13498.1 MAG: class I SAM-dependent methyltransferase [Thermomonospora sp. CIF 1]